MKFVGRSQPNCSQAALAVAALVPGVQTRECCAIGPFLREGITPPALSLIDDTLDERPRPPQRAPWSGTFLSFLLGGILRCLPGGGKTLQAA